MKTLEKVPLIAPWVGKCKPVPVRRVLCKKSSPNFPNRVRNTTRFIKNQHHAILIVYTSIRIWVLSTPQFIPPREIQTVAIDQDSGLKATDSCPTSRVVNEVFVSGTEPEHLCLNHPGNILSESITRPPPPEYVGGPED
jgi:hypothetical protein